MKIGYARVSTADQNLSLQIEALKEEGCDKVYEEYISGAKSERPELNKMLDTIREGDQVIIWKLDRLGRSLKHLIELVELFNSKNVSLKCINDPIDTSTNQGKLIFNIFASLAEFERGLIKERTMAGLKEARKRGRLGGRPKGLSDQAKKNASYAAKLYKEEKEMSIQEMCKRVGVSRATLYNYLRYEGIRIGK